MNLKLTRHFQDMMQFRGIDIEHVKKAIKSPDKKENVFGGRMKVIKKFGNRIIEVIYLKENFRDKDNEYLLITAYYI